MVKLIISFLHTLQYLPHYMVVLCMNQSTTSKQTKITRINAELLYHGLPHSVNITRYSSTWYIGIAMVESVLQYIRKCQFLLSVSSEFDF